MTAESITAEMIHTERVKELAFEGDRMLYLEALQLPLPPGERANAENVPFPYEGMYWTVPQSELDFRIDSEE